MKDPVDGTATLVGYSEQHEQKGSNVVLSAQVIVEAEGLASTTVDAKPEVPQSWMPVKTGTVWPVQVDRANPSRLKFLWDRVQPPAGATPAPAPGAMPAPVPGQPIVTKTVTKFSMGPASIRVLGGSVAPQQYKQAIDMAEQATGMDLDGDGKVAGGAAPAAGASPFAAFFQAAGAAGIAGVPAPAAPGPDDPVSKLERLAKLLDAGDITREEFDAEKKKVLGET
jgi:hypothetical protein